MKNMGLYILVFLFFFIASIGILEVDRNCREMTGFGGDITASAEFIVENMDVTIQFFKGEAFSVEPPNFVELKITECEPGVQGDTSKAGNKPAKLETGFIIQVPLFVNEGDTVRIDTRTGDYMERVKK